MPSARPDGLATGVVWALRGLSLASHAGVIVAAVALADPPRPAVIQAYTVEIVLSDSFGGGRRTTADKPQAPSQAAEPGAGAAPAEPPKRSAASVSDRAVPTLHAPEPPAPAVSRSERASAGRPDPAPSTEVADPPEPEPSTEIADSPEPQPSTEVADLPGPEPSAAAEPLGVLPAAGAPAPVPPASEARPASSARFPGLPPRKPPVPKGAREIAEKPLPTPETPQELARTSPPAEPASPRSRPANGVDESPPQLETVVGAAAPAAEEETADSVSGSTDLPGEDTSGAPSEERAVTAASYAPGHLGNIPPVYPYRARRKELQGRVVLRVDVLSSGKTRSVTVLSSSGHAILDRAALKVVRAWRFVPAKRAGVPVAGTIDVPITFRLTN